MKKIIISFIGALAVLFCMTACEKDYLDTVPTDQVSSAVAVLTTDNALTALNGIHRALYTEYGSQGRGGAGAFNIHIDEAGEDHVFNRSNWTHSYRWRPNSEPDNAYNTTNWKMFYQWVANANVLINGVDNATGEQADRDAVKGQALVYRAFCHFHLVRLWGNRYEIGGGNSQLGVPLKLDNSIDPIARNTVEEVYTQINKDLDEAIVLLNGYARKNKSHFNANVAKGLKARVALTQGNWSVAAQFAAEARAGFILMDAATYAQGFQIFSETNSEFMWASQIQEDQNTGNDAWGNYGAFISRNFSSSAIRGNPRSINNLLYDMISATDIRKTLWDPTGQHLNLPDGVSLLSSHKRFPYTNQKFIAVSNGDSRVDVPMMRAAEMYLIEAEALARNNQDGLAAQALYDMVITRDSAYTLSTNTGQALIDEIMVQRRVELWGEGFRWYDLKRLNLPLDRTGSNQSTTYTNGIMQVPVGDNRWTWPIPQDEIDANPLIDQNPI
ncbi:RagB/SusD family nutrient uptake outer membrane protein [Flavivirga spongiicola]|uniref:RagB/SusD family nutrient uptake outer membrane protein n=1 Tax=Flavivirga spongiicola TaxID=421621 RepID=A0ABU7XS32_9FLAO|nr:RagB/SusD family nutrient uptake outer membrane protein [Flavivirga sp. MEBiC05379]MDO5978589.1 RagB/SusD family nutrient uptake outer membrane protein [Flavivirga sp. MEBiC05379]